MRIEPKTLSVKRRLELASRLIFRVVQMSSGNVCGICTWNYVVIIGVIRLSGSAQ